MYRVAPIYDDELPSTVALKKTYKDIFLWEFDFKTILAREKHTHVCSCVMCGQGMQNGILQNEI